MYNSTICQESKFTFIYKDGFIIKDIKQNNNKISQINNQLLSMMKEGYLTASLDSIKKNKDSTKIFISAGKKFDETKFKIKLPDSEDLMIKDLLNSKKQTLNPISFQKKINSWLTYMNNNGFPFATFKFNQSILKQNEILINCELKKGPLITIDTIYNPEMSVKELKLVYKILKVKKNEPFNLSFISEMSRTLQSTKYLTTTKPVAYEFTNNKAAIYTYIKSKPINNINGLIGVQPSDEGEVQLTGNISLSLLNALKHGEKLQLNWRRMFNSSQNLITNFSLPFIFNSNLELIGDINMIKKDSSFFNIDLKTNLNYLIGINHSIGVVYNTFGSTNLIENDEYNSTSVSNFGFSLKYENLNKSFNPTKGVQIRSEISTGFKKTFITENNIDQELKTPNYFGTLNYKQYLQISKRTSFKLGASALSIMNENLFENELIRIGGYQNLRGFDEESISVSSFVIGTLEFLYLLDEKSNIFAFTDFAKTKKKINTENILTDYHSTGLGINLSLNNGFMTLIYALGRNIKQPFLIRTGKVHIGFTSFF